jgi:signal peptidase I
MNDSKTKETIIYHQGLESLINCPLRPKAAIILRVNGWSMFAAIPSGSFVRVESATGKHLKPKDIVLAKTSNGKLVIHRIIKKIKFAGKQGFIIKGDNQISQGEYINESDIFGWVNAIGRADKLYSIISGIGKTRDWLCLRLAFLTRRLLPLASQTLLFLQSIKIYRQISRYFFLPSLNFIVEQTNDKSYNLYGVSDNTVIVSANIETGPDSTIWQLSNLWVSLRFRGLGLGQTTMNEIIRLIKTKNGNKLRLIVDYTNKSALHFYQNTGFYCINTQNSRISAKKIIMEKKLR